MTLLTTVRPYHRLSDVLKEDVDAALTGFRAYLAMMRPKVSSVRPAPKNVTVSPLPASPVAESEPELDFLPKTDTQRRTRRIVQPRATPRRGVLPGEILAYLRKHGQATNRELAQGLGREHSSIKDATKRMAARGELQEIRFGKQGLLYKKGG